MSETMEVGGGDVAATETIWPDGYEAPPADWDWTPREVLCGHCGAPNLLPDQPPAWLATRDGVRWECSSCSGVNRLGGTDDEAPFEAIQECGSCHSTFAGGEGSILKASDVADDGTWSCPVCGTENRLVGGIEAGTGTTAEVAS